MPMNIWTCRFRSHDMLAPFTAGWQITDVNPLVIDKSEMNFLAIYVYDINGKKYLDSLAGLWCTTLGGSEPRLVEAATKQLQKLPFYHSFWNRTTQPSLVLAKDLIETFTARKMAKAFFVNSGSEANDTQVKLAWYYNNALGRPNKKKFIARFTSYHGSTLTAASLTGLSILHHKFDLPAPFVLHTDCPHYWRYRLPGATEEEYSTRLADNLEELILKEGPDTGCYVYDINGKKYLDALAGLWCTSLGGSESRLIEAATAQLKKLPFYHSFFNRTTEPSLVLANELIELFTARKMAKAFFVNSGSEANDTVVKLVWYYNNALGRPKKKKFIARDESYHGSTMIAASLSGLPALHYKFDLPLPFVLHTNSPHYWRYHLPGETEEEFSTRLANNLEKLILKEGPDTIAAFIAEPLMAAGGLIPPPATYFEKIQAVLKKYDILFVADEVLP
ncbi:hypothetical protein TanjilG_23392 [Lupinus angustifolius]|uniref:Aminotransferase class III-fold pyridoxal phosphate-dependent enzyme n=1 Tax=Lupinus angustifolius TaxID=3871 RepID=A0A4P1R9J9_LUPAN|nr:hypothetical protein TanjilG_23392 [Lupinus angustifolius]